MRKYALLAVAVAFAQSTHLAIAADDMSARKLFYQDNQPEVVFKAVAVAASAVRPSNLTAPASTPQQQQQQKKTAGATARPAQRPPQLPPNADMLAAKAKQALSDAIAAYTPDGTPVRKAANLGVRYNIMKYNADRTEAVAVPADSTFKKGDCLAIRMAPNRGGFLYVFNQATSGKWQPLLPSEELPEEPSTVKAFQTVSLPSQNCFEMDDPAGDERLFVMITEKPEDIKNLDDILKKLGKPASAPANAPQRPDTMVLAMNKLSETIQGLQSQLASRDIKITRVATAQSKGELPNTVYYVNAAASANDHLIMEIKLKHN